ncbi:hypothetical protein [Tenacibaculum piscium]|uniref:Uncharacterized protein n=1 Tax=Tenacibaculum piscium TaxID=1458515 RepID=A0A2H1YEX4_9FLAO|nr:hypothetical protein [Tenacibaculum piscium]MBE7630518.1 hypothetical protein [Tenacibaculum piscium]MBE7671715.1 hypothetical protein [Tenacibaculum piscium]SOS73970.1 conserved hypothetical protein [Tenacibaculum piscium]
MKDRKVHIILVLFFVVSISIPIWLWVRDYGYNRGMNIDSSVLSEFATFQSLIIAFWGLIINVILVIIAYKAFQNFDVKKQFHNKQLDVVSELSSEISSTQLSNMFYETKTDPTGKDHLIATGYTLSFFEIALAFKYDKMDLMCVKTNNIENTFPFLSFRNHPLLPKSISKRLNKLYRPLQYSMAILKKDMPKNYVILYSDKVDKDDYSKDWTYEFYKVPKDFSKDCLDLRTEIIKWYKEFGANDLNI